MFLQITNAQQHFTAFCVRHRIRLRLRRLRNDLVRQMENIAGSNADLFQDRSVGIRSGRFVLQLKAEARNRYRHQA